MSETKLICTGCGSVIQTENKNEVGYIPKSVLESYDFKDRLYCQRCFRMRNYSQLVSNDIPGEDYIKVIEQIKLKDSLVVLIVDVFDFSGSFLPNIKKLTGQNDFILACNKLDLLPSSV